MLPKTQGYALQHPHAAPSTLTAPSTRCTVTRAEKIAKSGSMDAPERPGAPQPPLPPPKQRPSTNKRLMNVLSGLHVVGRTDPHGRQHATTIAQSGIVHRWRWTDDGSTQSVYVLGGASSVAFSGDRLATILRPGLDLQNDAMARLSRGDPHVPLSLHTSAGGTRALEPFVAALQRHLPWPEARDGSSDWFLNLQVEGSSAVLAACDILVQQAAADDGYSNNLSSAPRRKIAVGACSYHGPPSTSPGSAEPLGSKGSQLEYPVPAPHSISHALTLRAFAEFLDLHAHEIGALLVEPQWGSSLCAQPWPPALLRQYIAMAQAKNIRVCCDEVMCGLGRHGCGTLFLSEAWNLNPDAVT